MNPIPRYPIDPMQDPSLPETMAPSADPLGMTAPAMVQHPMHAMIAPISAAPPKVTAMSPDGEPFPTKMSTETPKSQASQMSPLDQRESQLEQGLQKKPQGFWGNFGHYAGMAGRIAGDIVAPGQTETIVGTLGKEGIGPRANEMRNSEIADIEKQKSEQGLQGAQTNAANAHAEELTPVSAPESITAEHPELADLQLPPNAWQRLASTLNTNQTRTATNENTVQGREDVGAAHNKTLEDIASMHQAAQRAFQHVAGSSGGKNLYANYDPSKGVFTDLNGNILTDFKPENKAMQGAYGAYGPMRLAGQLLNYASNDNPALIPILSPIISHMIAGAGGGNAAQIQDVLGKIPGAQPQDDQGQPIGLRMPGAPTGATRSRGQFAESILPSISDAENQINKLGDKLGPMSGRFSELYNGKIGAYGPEYSGLQTTLHNIGTAWMRLHANSESARQDFLNALSSAKDPANLIANLRSIDSQARDYVQQGKGRGGQPVQNSATPARPSGVPATAKYITDPSTGKKGWAW